MLIKDIIQAIEKKQSNYNEYMTDMGGDWLYDDRSDIEADLGMKLEDFDRMSELKSSLLKLEKMGFKEWRSFSASEAAALYEALGPIDWKAKLNA